MTRRLFLLLCALVPLSAGASDQAQGVPALGTHMLDFDGTETAPAAADAFFAALAAHEGQRVTLTLRIRPDTSVPVPEDYREPVEGLGYAARYLLRDGTPLEGQLQLRCSSGSCGGLDNFLRIVEVETAHPAGGPSLLVRIGDRMLDPGQIALCEYVPPGEHRWTEMELKGTFQVLREGANGWRLEGAG